MVVWAICPAAISTSTVPAVMPPAVVSMRQDRHSGGAGADDCRQDAKGGFLPVFEKAHLHSSQYDDT